MKILVSVFNNLATDQRVEKICSTFYNNGEQVILIGNDWKGKPPLERKYQTHRIVLVSRNLKLAYPEFNYKLYLWLLKNSDHSTILYSNDLDTLLPNYLVSKKLGIPLIYDSHEIYTEMPTLKGRFTKKIWLALEKNLLPKIKYIITASKGYASFYQKKYNLEMPIVVQNFPKSRRIDSVTQTSEKKIILYQGSINPSRGLDKIIPVMKQFLNTELWIVGGGPKLNEYKLLTLKLNADNCVKFLGLLLPEELQKITPKADVGISIEENNGESYYQSLPNKISDYIQARVPIVTSNFPQMKEIIDKYKVGVFIENHSEQELFKKISEVLYNGKKYYQKNLEIAAQSLIWEKEEKKLLNVLERAKTQIRIKN